MKRTLSIPVDVNKEKTLKLLSIGAEVFNKHVQWAFDNKTYNKNKAHKDLYFELRSSYPELPSALLQTIRDSALESIKALKFKRKPQKKKTSSIRFDRRTMTLRGNQLTFSSLGKRDTLILNIPDFFKPIFDNWKFCGGTLGYSKQQRSFVVNLTFEHPDPDKLSDGKVLGLDRGLYQLVTTSDGQFFSSNKLREIQRKYLYNRKTLQAKGTRSAKRRLRAMAGKEQRFSRDVNHCVSKKLAHLPAVKVFVLENLKGIRNKRRGRKLNKWLASWPFFQFEQFLTYKADALGKEVAYVDARYTSQSCSRCKNRNATYRKKSKFECKTCGFRCHADINAAMNIRDKFVLSQALSITGMSIEQGAVNHPYVTGVDDKATIVELRPSLVTSYQPCAGGI